MAGEDGALLLLVTIRLAPEGLAAFDAYEAAVLPRLGAHGGRLERRLRGADDRTEWHLLRFPSRRAFEAYLADEGRLAASALWTASRAMAEIREVRDLQPV